MECLYFICFLLRFLCRKEEREVRILARRYVVSGNFILECVVVEGKYLVYDFEDSGIED